MKCLVQVLVIVSLILTLTGCWNNRDLTDLAIMTGVAFDQAEDGQVPYVLG